MIIGLLLALGADTRCQLWQRDLWMCIDAHATMDAIGFRVVPLLARA